MKNNYKYTELTHIAIDQLIYTMYTPDGMYGYKDNDEQMVDDFIRYFYKGTRQSWWCDGIRKRMNDAMRLTHEYLEYQL